MASGIVQKETEHRFGSGPPTAVFAIVGGLHTMSAGGSILLGSGVLGVAGLATFSQAGCGETQGGVAQTGSWPSKE